MAKTKEERFKDVAGRRTNSIIKTLRLLANCSNKNNYTFTKQQINKIFSAIDYELKVTKAKFDEKTKEQEEFKL